MATGVMAFLSSENPFLQVHRGNPFLGQLEINAGVALLHASFPVVERGLASDRFRN